MKEEIQKKVEKFLNLLLVDFTSIDIEQDEDFYSVNILSEESSRLIWKHGAILAAIQNVLGSIIKNSSKDYIKLSIDIEWYKQKQKENILNLARLKALKVIETWEEFLMPPMSPYLRRLVHTYISDNQEEFTEVKTASVWEWDSRQIKLYK